MDYMIGIDVGGTHIAAGLLDESLQVVRTLKRSTEADRGAAHVIGIMTEMADDLLAAQGIERDQVMAVGAGIPGLIDPEQGICKSAGNLQWRDVKVAGMLQERLGLPVFIDNDVRAYVYGEALNGAGRGHQVVFGITLGTGLAAALVHSGRLYYGAGYMAGEIGHIRVPGEDHPCGCGLRGCLETVASATGIARLAEERMMKGRTSVLREWAGEGGEPLTAALVSRAYDQGDALAREVLEAAGRTLGRALANAVTLLSPDVLVIGGGAANAGERLLAPMREELQASLMSAYWDRLHIRTAEHMEEAGVIGSAAIARLKLQGA